MPLNADKAEAVREEREEVLEAMLKLSNSCEMSELEFVKLMEVFCDTRRQQLVPAGPDWLAIRLERLSSPFPSD
jgi:hypothetical protein